MIVARPQIFGEMDLLHGHETACLRFKTLDGVKEIVSKDAPPGGWTHEALEAVVTPSLPWDAYLESRWIGSSEI